MLLLMLMPKRTATEKTGDEREQEDGFMRQHGGRGPRLTFLCFEAISDLIIRVQDALAKRQR